MMANLSKGLGAFADAFSGSQQGQDIGAELAKQNASMLSEEEQRAAEALKLVTARNPRLRKAGAFG